MATADFILIGGGIAGLSAAALLARHGRVAVIEAEEAFGHHSSGRSVTFSHFGIGNRVVRALTDHSRDFFLSPPEGFSAPLARSAPALFVATEEMLDELHALHAEMARFTAALEWVGESRLREICPPLRTGAGGALKGILDPNGLKLDADALLQSFARAVRARGGAIHLGERIAGVERYGADWRVRSETGQSWEAPVLVNAAGAWADRMAQMAGVEPLGLEPKRRTIIVVDAPEGVDVAGWPFLKTAVDDFYMLPEAGRLIASPVDEIASDPCDAWPEEYDIALAAAKVEQYTNLEVKRIAHSWAGLRSFVADRVPTAGFAPDAPGFFWLAGQGGYGLQTAPAMAEIAEALIVGGEWPEGLSARGVGQDKIGPDRLFVKPNESPSVRQG
ncbi:MAG TPA: FAD-binding oxidoreductase [Allosphingosinicella sp.]